MRIAVVSANGRSGKAFVKLALKEGYKVTAGVYGENDFNSHQNLKVIQCDATKYDDIYRLVKNQDAVVSLIGHTKNSPKLLQTIAIKNIIKAADEQDLKRIISLTGTGVRFKGDKITLIDRFLNVGIKIVDPNRVKDGIEHVRKLQQSNTDWTVVRVLKLQNTKPKKFSLIENGPAKLIVSRDEVAEAIIEVIDNKSFVKQAPIIGKKI